MDYHARTAGEPDLNPGIFLTTRWSRVILAGEVTSEEAHEALSDLCRDYWRPLYHFARRKGHAPEDAQDFTQGFIQGLLEKNGIALADRQRGRFRTFLLSSFCNFLAGQHRGATALKRGGGLKFVSLDAEATEFFSPSAVEVMTPELHFERSWALALLERVMTRLRGEYAQAGRLPLFETLHPHLSGAAGRPGYDQLSAALGLSPSTVAVTMHRMRRRYGELLREEIAATVMTSDEVEDELRYLMRVIAAPQGG